MSVFRTCVATRCAIVAAGVQAAVLLYCGAMVTSDGTAAALSSVMEEANARDCISCGKRTAVLTEATTSEHGKASGFAAGMVWFCFECGYEEPSAA